MKILILGTILLLNIIATAQQKTSVNQYNNKGKGQQNNNTGLGSQIINNYYTNNQNYNKALTAKENAINATRGFFKQSRDSITHLPVLFIGGNYGIAMSDQVSVIGMNQDPINPVQISLSKGKLDISVVLRDSKGDEFARLSGNTWEISNSQNIEYNNDAHGFEIRTGKRIIFQIDIQKDTITVNGLFCSEDGTCASFDPEGNTTLPYKLGKSTQRFVLSTKFNIKPIFKYPRFQYLGIREQ